MSAASLALSEVDENEETVSRSAEVAESDEESVQIVTSQPKRRAASKAKTGAAHATEIDDSSKAKGGRKSEISVAPAKAGKKAAVVTSESAINVEETKEDAEADAPSQRSRGKPAAAACKAKASTIGTKKKKESMSAESVSDSTALLSAVMAASEIAQVEEDKELPEKSKGLTRSARSKDLADSRGSSKTSGSTKVKKGKKPKASEAPIEIETEAEDGEQEQEVSSQPKRKSSQQVEVVIAVPAKKVGNKASNAGPAPSGMVTDTAMEVEAIESQVGVKDLIQPKTRKRRTRAASSAPKAAPAARKGRTKAAKDSLGASTATSAAETESELEHAILPVRNGQPTIVRQRIRTVSPPKLMPARSHRRNADETVDESDALTEEENEDAASVTEADLSRVTASTKQYEGDEDITRHDEGELSEAEQEDLPTPKAKSVASGSSKSKRGRSSKSAGAKSARSKASSRTRTRSQAQSSAAIMEEQQAQSVSEAESAVEQPSDVDDVDQSAIVAAVKVKRATAKTRKSAKAGPAKNEMGKTRGASVNESMATASAVEPGNDDSHPVEAGNERNVTSTHADSRQADAEVQVIEEMAEMEVLISPPRETDTAPADDLLQETVRRPPAPAAESAAAEVSEPVLPIAVQQPARTVKALPQRKSSLTAKPASTSAPLDRQTTVASVQSALDALLARPVPTFDTPAKPVLASPECSPGLEVEAADSLALRALAVQPITKEEENMPVKTWFEACAKREVENFGRETDRMLAEWDRRVREGRVEVSAFSG